MTLLVLAVVCALAFAQEAPPKAGSVQGVVRVEGPDGAPLADLTVEVGKLSTVTGPNGRYELRDVPPGRHDLRVGHPFSSPVGQTAKPVTIVAGQAVVVDFALPLLAVVSGRVTDEFDDPVPDVEVVMLDAEYSAGTLRWSRRIATRTNDEGVYRIERARPGVRYVLLARPIDMRRLPAMSEAPSDPRLRRPASVPTYFPGVSEREGATQVRLRGGERREGLDIRLLRAPSFCIEASAGAGRADRLFTVQETNLQLGIVTGGVTGLPRHGPPGPDGAFRLCDLPPGEYSVSVVEGDLNDPQGLSSAIVSIRDGDVARLTLPRAPALQVPVEFAWAGPPPEKPTEAKLRLALISRTRSFGGYPSTEAVNAPGVTELKEVVMDEYVHRIVGLNGRLYVKDVLYGNDTITFAPFRPGTAPSGSSVKVLLGHDGVTVRARVRNHDGAAAAYATVVVMPESHSTEGDFAGKIRHGRADQTGAYTALRAVAPGKLYLVALSAPLGEPVRPEEIERLLSLRSRAKEVVAQPNADIDVDLEAIE